ncbi:MAG: hypothetical protein LUM44_17740 [Pyrinomonadaceae bacterium]|nr:hypothetical protein [Pyrinomonadaceae bacterium]
MSNKPIIWNYGGGKQTAAIAVLIRQGVLPRPERIVMADTGRECKTTFEYLENYMRPLLHEVGCEVEVIPHSFSKQDLYYINKNKEESQLPVIPTWTRQNGEVGKMRTFCSGFWKRDVVRDWLLLPEQGYGRKNPVIQWIGFSLDEISRCKDSDVQWREHHYPLIWGYNVRMTRQECVDLVLNYGLPEPPKSRCWMCGEQNNEEWRDVQSRPDEWQKAVELDYEIRSRDESNAVYLHFSGVPLIEADLSDKPKRELSLFQYDQMTCSEGCWT